MICNIVPFVTKHPSQIRYEKNHPLISIRLSEWLKATLDSVKGDMSYPEIIRMNIVESARMCKIAENRYRITIPCAVCGKPMVVEPNGPFHQEILSRMKPNGWLHTTCKRV